MFHFAMHLKHIDGISEKHLNDDLIYIDEIFGKKFITEFLNSHPDYDKEGTEDYYEWCDIDMQLEFFRSEKSPKNFDEAIEIVRGSFFHLPEKLWIDGKEVCVEEYSSSDLIQWMN